MSHTTDATPVSFWFDPSCPWAWMTSRWIDTVTEPRNLDVTWNVMSLAVLNEGKDVPEEYRAFFPTAKKYTLVITAAIQLHGQQYAKPLYDAFGARIHLQQMKDTDEIIAGALAEVGLSESLAERALSGEFEQALRDSHNTGISLVGEEVGTPVIQVNGLAFFGPVISPAPTGQQALDLWDGILLTSSYEGFFELKRTRTVGPIF